MAENINLSQDLINNVLDAITSHEPDAQKDMMLNLQYLSAITGYLSADYPGSASDIDELLAHMHSFMKHVCSERLNSEKQQEQPSAEAEQAAGKSVATDDPAVGIWKPE